MTRELVIKPVLDELERDLRQVEKLTDRSVRRALRFAQKQARTLTAREVAQINGYPVGVVRRRIYTPRPVKGATPVGTVYVHTLPVLARNFSRSAPVQQKEGARVGTVRFPGAFVFAGKYSGRLIVGKRRRKARLPIDEPKKTIREFERVAARVVAVDARFAFNREFERQQALALNAGET